MQNDEVAITLKEAARRLGLSYQTVFAKRHQIAFRLEGTTSWRIWPSMLAEITKPRNNVTQLTLRVANTNGDHLCPSANMEIRRTGGSIYARQAASALDNLLGQATKSKRKNTTTA